MTHTILQATHLKLPFGCNDMVAYKFWQTYSELGITHYKANVLNNITLVQYNMLL